jgi:hypothetical protein
MSIICRKLIKVGSGFSAYWDVAGGHGPADYLTGDPAIEQTVACELQLILGGWFLDVSRGIPWYVQPNATATPILGVFPADLARAEALIKAAILSVPGVNSLKAFSLDFNHATRAAKCVASGITENGGAFTVGASLP